MSNLAVEPAPARALSRVYPNLQLAVAYHGLRWSPASVAAAAAIDGAWELTPPEWAALLDRIDAALVELLTQVHSGTFRASRFLGH